MMPFTHPSPAMFVPSFQQLGGPKGKLVLMFNLHQQEQKGKFLPIPR